VNRLVGFAFEDEFVRMAQANGYSAVRVHGNYAFDAVVAGKRVQCKRKNFAEHGKVRIAKGQHKYGADDWDVLALSFRDTLFLVPAKILVHGEWLRTTVYPHRLSLFENKWDVFMESVAREHQRERQQNLF